MGAMIPELFFTMDVVHLPSNRQTGKQSKASSVGDPRCLCHRGKQRKTCKPVRIGPTARKEER
jgi:hypothetical protein